MPIELETIFSSVKEAAGFVMKNAKALATEFLKVAALGLLLQIVFVLILVAIDAAGGGLSSNLTPGTESPMQMALIGAAIVFFIIFSIGSAALAAVNYCIIDAMARGGKAGIIEKTKGLLLPAAQYMLAVIALAAVVFIVPAIVDTIPGGQMFSALLFLALIIVAAVVLFAIQFSFPEIAINGKGAFDSFIASQALARKGIWVVIGFDLILSFIILSLGMAFSVLREALDIVLNASVADAVAQTSAQLVLSMVMSLVQNFILSIVAVPLIYFFWKAICGESPEAAPQPKSIANPERGRRKRSKR